MSAEGGTMRQLAMPSDRAIKSKILNNPTTSDGRICKREKQSTKGRPRDREVDFTEENSDLACNFPNQLTRLNFVSSC